MHVCKHANAQWLHRLAYNILDPHGLANDIMNLHGHAQMHTMRGRQGGSEARKGRESQGQEGARKARAMGRQEVSNGSSIGRKVKRITC